jgi:hypothetical protein
MTLEKMLITCAGRSFDSQVYLSGVPNFSRISTSKLLEAIEFDFMSLERSLFSYIELLSPR